jgi:thioester reductase-like protein
VILLTGASGVVGSAVLGAGHADVVCLRHRRPVAGESVSGDITRPRIGLDRIAYRRLCERIDVVVHAAATVNLEARAEEYEEVNVAGAAQLARFAADAEARMIFVSTAFVHGHTEAGAATYPASKLRAEEIVREGRAAISVVRPSIVAGDSGSGEIAEGQGFHRILSSLVEGPIRIVPADEGARIDFVPQDYVAAVIRALADTAKMPSELWLTSGARALSVNAAVEAVNAAIAAADLPGDPARIVPDETVDRLFVPALLPELPARTRARVKMLLKLARHMRIEAALPSSTAMVERCFEIELPDPRVVLEANLRRLTQHLVPAELAAASR